MPGIVGEVAELQLYQRTPPWVVPRPNEPFPRWLKTRVRKRPGTCACGADRHLLVPRGPRLRDDQAAVAAHARCRRWASGTSAAHVKDKDLRRRLTPTYRAGCKRILYSPNYYQAVADPKTELITERIARVTPDGIVTADGTEHEVDVIVCATGFHVTDSYTYVDIKGPGGEDLVDRWNRDGVAAHRGIAVADMPEPVLPARPEHRLWDTTRWCS